MTGAFTESVVEDAALRDGLLPKLISGHHSPWQVGNSLQASTA